MPSRTELNELYSAAHELKQVIKERDELRAKLAALESQKPIGSIHKAHLKQMGEPW